ELELLNEPVELLLLHDQRRCEANDLLMRVFAQNAALEQLLGELPRRAGVARDLDTNQKTASPDRSHVLGVDRHQSLHQIGTELLGAAREPRIDCDLERRFT